ncbi:MAG TPA: hypothetical protein PKV67_16480 [Hyphomonas sp.]|nr:hypothetical protein [Hyphomonas sp.]
MIDLKTLIFISKANDHDIDQYTTGECHVFAVALHRRFGWPMLAVLDYGEPYWENSEDPEDFIPAVCHVFAIDPDGQAWDVMGIRKREDVREEVESWCSISDYVTEHLSIEDELAPYVGEWGEDGEGNLIDQPLHAFTEKDVEEATEKAFRIFAGHPVFEEGVREMRKPGLPRLS